jgi:hypothetical protein
MTKQPVVPCYKAGARFAWASVLVKNVQRPCCHDFVNHDGYAAPYRVL